MKFKLIQRGLPQGRCYIVTGQKTKSEESEEHCERCPPIENQPCWGLTVMMILHFCQHSMTNQWSVKVILPLLFEGKRQRFLFQKILGVKCLKVSTNLWEELTTAEPRRRDS